MPALAQRLTEAARRLDAVTETPRLDAELLLAHALGLNRAQLLARLRDEAATPGFEELLERRLNCEPIAYITGAWEFFSLEFACRSPILVPRPETEHLVEAALENIAQRGGAAPLRLLDLCTGTGCVAIAIAKNAPNTQVTATDINPGALRLAQKNAQRHGVDTAFHEGDLFNALPNHTPPFDIITANPPYVADGEWDGLSPVITRHEDPRALLAGPDGLDAVRRIIHEAKAWLHPGGMLAIEMGEGHLEAVDALLRENDYAERQHINDLAGTPRVIQALREA